MVGLLICSGKIQSMIDLHCLSWRQMCAADHTYSYEDFQVTYGVERTTDFAPVGEVRLSLSFTRNNHKKIEKNQANEKSVGQLRKPDTHRRFVNSISIKSTLDEYGCNALSSHGFRFQDP